MLKGVTKRQREIIDFIDEFTAVHRYAPSYREIGNHFGFSSLGSVHKHIATLKRKGILDSEKKASRSLTLNSILHSDTKKEAIIPLIGYISASVPIHLFPQTQEVIVPNSFVHASEKTYALRAQGNSLAEEMIVDGDLLVFEARSRAHPGETIIALINQQDTVVKKFYLEEGYVRLSGVHSHHHPMRLREEDVAIQGILTGLLRSF